MNDRLVQSQTVLGPSVDGLSSPPLAQAAEVLWTFLVETRQEHKNHSFEVLGVLARWTRDRACKGLSTAFTASNLKAEVAPETSKEPSGWLSPLWRGLAELESQWQEGLEAVARRHGLAYLPRLIKDQGNPAHYRLEPMPLLERTSPDDSVPLPSGGIRYTPEAVAAPAAWLISTMKSGVVRWTLGLRWTVAAGIIALTLLAIVGVAATFTLGLRITRPLTFGDLVSLLALASFVAILIPIHRFFDDLFDLRIVMAPDALTPLAQTNVTLEVRKRSPEDDVGELAFVRYSALCAKCDGSVAIFAGGNDLPGRLVGRCRRSGREHVYTFDHVLRVGSPLR
jgi:hypothetical protein